MTDTAAQPNFDLALIYDTDCAFEKVASASKGKLEQPTLADYVVHLTREMTGEDDPDLEKVAEVHTFLIEADRLGRAYAQKKFGELEESYLSGDPEARALLEGLFADSGESAGLSKVAAAARAELERRGAELAKTAGVGRTAADYVASRIAGAKGRAVGYAMKAGADKVGVGSLAKGFGREFGRELAAGGAAGAAGLAAGSALGGQKKTTVVYR